MCFDGIGDVSHGRGLGRLVQDALQQSMSRKTATTTDNFDIGTTNDGKERRKEEEGPVNKQGGRAGVGQGRDGVGREKLRKSGVEQGGAEQRCGDSYWQRPRRRSAGGAGEVDEWR